MGVSITTDPHARTLTITVTEADWEKTQGQSFYQGEQAVQQIVTRIGRELVRELLQSKGVAEPTLEADGQRWYRKEASLGHYHTLYGEVAVERHLYQTSAGGDTRCPLEELCQLSFAAATPLLAEVLSFKVSAMTPTEVAQDVAKQGLVLSPSFIQQTAQRVGQIAVQKSAHWAVGSPEPARPVRTIATGLDGTTVPLREEHYKEAMCGTIALYDGKGQRLATTYLGAIYHPRGTGPGPLSPCPARRTQRRGDVELATDCHAVPGRAGDSGFLACRAASGRGERRYLRLGAQPRQDGVV